MPLAPRPDVTLPTPGSQVRSVSIQHGHLLGVGHKSLDFFDLRRLRNSHVDIFRARPDPGLLLQRIDMRAVPSAVNPVLQQYGVSLSSQSAPAVYAHCWDPSGTRLVAAGGALSLGGRGTFMQLLM